MSLAIDTDGCKFVSSPTPRHTSFTFAQDSIIHHPLAIVHVIKYTAYGKMSLPDFTSTTLFPSFLTIPELDRDTPVPSSTTPGEASWHLLAQIKDNMTINKPTLVLKDRDDSPFALVFEGLERDELDLKGLGFKKGCTAVIPNATRTKPAEEGKRGFVRIEKGDASGVKAIPGPLARVLELGGKVKGGKCETCGADGPTGLKGCTGCGRAGYCSKVREIMVACSRNRNC